MIRHENIVVVAEDDILTRMLAVETVEEEGYTVVEAGHAGEALDAIERHGGGVAALFTDVHMPGGITGLELARHVHAHWPRVAILITSGLHQIKPGEIPPGGRFVAKPYEPASIVAHLKALLN